MARVGDILRDIVKTYVVRYIDMYTFAKPSQPWTCYVCVCVDICVDVYLYRFVCACVCSLFCGLTSCLSLLALPFSPGLSSSHITSWYPMYLLFLSRFSLFDSFFLGFFLCSYRTVSLSYRIVILSYLILSIVHVLLLSFFSFSLSSFFPVLCVDKGESEQGNESWHLYWHCSLALFTCIVHYCYKGK